MFRMIKNNTAPTIFAAALAIALSFGFSARNFGIDRFDNDNFAKTFSADNFKTDGVDYIRTTDAKDGDSKNIDNFDKADRAAYDGDIDFVKADLDVDFVRADVDDSFRLAKFQDESFKNVDVFDRDDKQFDGVMDKSLDNFKLDLRAAVKSDDRLDFNNLDSDVFDA